jgi:uncharacterized membrane protein
MLLTHHLLSVHLLLLLWGLLVKRHLILGQTSYKGGVAMMMLMMYARAAQLILLVLSPCTNLVVQRSARLRFELDARHVAYHYQISWVCRFSLEEHGRLTGGQEVLVMRGEFHQTLRVIGSLLEYWLLHHASLSPTW